MDKLEEASLSHLLQERGKAYDNIDKTILTLSAAAIGVSITYIKEIIGTQNPSSEGFLYTAWGCWAFSVVFVLLSYYSSIGNIDHQIDKLEEKRSPKWVRLKEFCVVITRFLNIGATILFIVGLFLLILFVRDNIKVKAEPKTGSEQNVEQQSNT